MKETGNPPTLAPEICVEVLSAANDWEEMHEKRGFYLEAGAREVWIVDREGRVRFFGDEELDQSEVVPDVPKHV
ncbi:MAG: Uma2 family endonuclease [Salinibacter sp.]